MNILFYCEKCGETNALFHGIGAPCDQFPKRYVLLKDMIEFLKPHADVYSTFRDQVTGVKIEE